MPGTAAEAQQKGQIAAQTLFTAASAANAIPVAGQFVSAGLAIAGLFTKLFAGKGKARRERRAAEQRKRTELAKQAAQSQVQATQGSGVGVGNPQGPVGATAPVQTPIAPSFSSYGGGAAPPVQQALNSSIGLK